MTNLIIPSRRSFLTGLASTLIAAPAIVRATSIMPVRAIDTNALDAALKAVAELEARLEMLRASYAPWRAHWEALANEILPERYSFLVPERDDARLVIYD